MIAIVSDKIFRTNNKSGVIQVVALNIFKAFVRVRRSCILHKRKTYGI